MARIAGVDLPKDKKIEIALTYIYGIGPASAKKILAEPALIRTRKAIILPNRILSRFVLFLIAISQLKAIFAEILPCISSD